MAELLQRPLYSTSEAARLLDLSAQTLRRWLEGYTAAGTWYPPVLRPKSTGDDAVTWGEFVEAAFLREYRDRRVSLQRIRPFVEALRKEFEVLYPLAHFRPAVDPQARELVLELQQLTDLDEDLYLVVQRGAGWQLQWSAPMEQFLDKVDFDEAGIVQRLYPQGPERRVALDPEMTFGLPQVSGVRTETIGEAYATGESIARIAEQWGLTRPDVEAALRWELQLKAA